jgi:hypothetical protein
VSEQSRNSLLVPNRMSPQGPSQQRWRRSAAALVMASFACCSPTTSAGNVSSFAGKSGSAGIPAVVAGTSAGMSPGMNTFVPVPVLGVPAVAGTSAAAPAPRLGASAAQGSSWPATAPSCGDIGLDCGTKQCEPTATVCNAGASLCLPRAAMAVTEACKPGSCWAAQPYCVAGQCL